MIKCRDDIRHQGFDNNEVTVVDDNQHFPHQPVVEYFATHLMDTPKHLIAIAASKNTAALGNVNSATAKKEARRCGALTAHRESRYRPNAATPPDSKHVIIPGIRPAEARACQITR